MSLLLLPLLLTQGLLLLALPNNVHTTISTAHDTSDAMCCHHIDDGPDTCRRACQQVSMETGTQQQLHQLAEVARTCPQHLVTFWQCVNNTFAAVSSSDVWSGLSCCGLPLVYQCQNSCRRARSRDDLGSSCRPDQELSFFSCLDRQEVGERCCGGPVSAQCLATCKGIFLEDTVPSDSTLGVLNDHCNEHVIECVHNYTMAMPTLNPDQSLQCCEQAHNMACRTGCREILTTLKGEEEIVEELSKVCGHPSFTDSMWQCFLIQSSRGRPKSHTSGTIETAGIDGAKLSCCSKARTDSCRKLCVKTYSRGWTQSWTHFDRKCVADPLESELNLCLDDVDQRCELGCSGLNYCTNFNGRPTELFRSCNSLADKAAWKDVKLWETGVISLPQGTTIPVKNIRECRPEMWRAIACTLQIKPCHRSRHTTHICRSDCVEILTDCVNWERIDSDHSADSLCTMLNAQDDHSKCIRLHHFLESGPLNLMLGEVTSPCRTNPCNHNEVCLLNRRKCKNSHNCRPYVCKPACQLGEVSQYLVSEHSYVRIPRSSDSRRVCHKVCRCGHHGMLSHCANVGCTESCVISTGRIQAHGSKFQDGCKWCACSSGDVVCDQRHCLPPYASDHDRRYYTGLPCNCLMHYMPVCGQNGRTYPSICIAECMGLTDEEFIAGSCEVQDPCDPNPCGIAQRCVPRHKMCLTSTPECKQYQCISITVECDHHQKDPVCDTTGEEFTNLCLLESRGRTLAHYGHCLSGCRRAGVVCGHNGAFYRSECAAWGDGTSVDYFGICKTVGYLTPGEKNPICDDIVCPSQPSVPCRMITPPGACCPICGGEIRVLYSPSQVTKATKAAKLSEPMAVLDVLSVIRQHISIAECGAFSYLTIEKDLVILIMPVILRPSELQYEACIMEAEKIGTLLASSSPIILSHLPLHAVAAAHTRLAKVGVSTASSPLTAFSTSLWTILIFTWLLAWIQR